MNSERISVVIPIYNCASTLNRCMDSLFRQTYTDFELILVDDGSTDASGALADDYAARDSRVKVIHQKNSGPSRARNVGMDAATGEYFCFVDSDDVVEPDYLEYLITNLRENNVDIATCGVWHEDVDGAERGKKRVFPAHIAEAAEILRPYRPTFQSYPYCKLFRRRALTLEDGSLLHYQEDIRIGEDRLFWCEAILKNGRAWISSAQKYHYIYYTSSLYHSRDYDKSYEDYVGRCRMEKMLDAIPELHDVAIEHAMDTAMYALSYDRFDERSDEIFAYARENGRWKVYFRSDKQFNRRIQALFIGIDPRLYVVVRKIRLRLRGRKAKRG